MDNICVYCGSEMKVSSKGNKYCSNICWEKEPFKALRKQTQIEASCIFETEHGDWGDR